MSHDDVILTPSAGVSRPSRTELKFLAAKHTKKKDSDSVVLD